MRRFVFTLIIGIWVMAPQVACAQDSYGFQGDGGDRAHASGRTGPNAEYDFRVPARFTGDTMMGETHSTRQNSLQGMLSGPENMRTQTGLLAPRHGESFAGQNTFGFHGSTDSLYHGPYQSRGLVGRLLPGTGTGEVKLNILDSSEFDGDSRFIQGPNLSRLELLREYLAKGGKLERGSITEEERRALGLKESDLTDGADY